MMADGVNATGSRGDEATKSIGHRGQKGTHVLEATDGRPRQCFTSRLRRYPGAVSAICRRRRETDDDEEMRVT